MENINQIEKQIFEYIAKNTSVEMKSVVPQTMLFREGIFDSMGFVLLIDFLEENFGIRTDDNDLIEENFESVLAITNFIQRKRTATAA